MRRLQLQLAGEILRPTAAALVLLIQLLFAMQLLRGADLVLGTGVSAREVGRMGLLLAPHFLAMSMPIALLAGILVGLGRLAEDRELLARAAAGIDPIWLLPVPLCLAALLSLAGLALGRGAEPRGIAGVRALAGEAVEKNLQGEVRPGVFFDQLAGLTVYAEQVDPQTHAWRHVLVHDDRDRDTPMLVLAQGGALELDSAGAMALALRDGEAHRSSARDDAYSLLRFDSGKIRVGVGDGATAPGVLRSPADELDTPALIEAAREAPTPTRSSELWTAVERRSALPLAPLAFALVAVPLGARLRRGARSLGLIVAACSYGVYYVLARAGEQWGDAGVLAPAIAAQLANLAFAAAGAVLLLRARRRA